MEGVYKKFKKKLACARRERESDAFLIRNPCWLLWLCICDCEWVRLCYKKVMLAVGLFQKRNKYEQNK